MVSGRTVRGGAEDQFLDALDIDVEGMSRVAEDISSVVTVVVAMMSCRCKQATCKYEQRRGKGKKYWSMIESRGTVEAGSFKHCKRWATFGMNGG